MVQYYYRENALINHLFGVENTFREWLGIAKKIVIAGLSFNDYDHELISGVANYARGNKTEITIINRAETEEEETTKTNKVKGLFPSAKSITFINTEKIQCK